MRAFVALQTLPHTRNTLELAFLESIYRKNTMLTLVNSIERLGHDNGKGGLRMSAQSFP